MGLGGALKKVSSQVRQAIKDTPSSAANVATAVGSVGAIPITATLAAAGSSLTAAAPVLQQASGIVQSNPALAGILGDALGIPGLGGAFGGGGAASGDAGYAGMPTAKASVPVWVWIGGGIVALVGLVLLLRKP